jgi:tRNA(Ile)-lysidine synthase
MLLESVRHACSQLSEKNTCFVGFSGGLDSHVLLHLLAEVNKSQVFRIQAVHINHQLSANANQWEEHCRKVCHQLSIPFQSFAVTIDQHANIEAQARKKRYAIFSSLLKKGDVMFIAHHQDDQAETVLVQLMRGAGPKGLASMPMTKSLGLGQLVRPLLQHPRNELEQYASDHQLSWIEDESNHSNRFARNYLRRHILPMLKKRWPSAAKTLSRVAANCHEAQALLDSVAQQDLQLVQGSVEQTLSIKQLVQLEPARQRQVLRAWIVNLSFSLPSKIKLDEIMKTVLVAKADKMPQITWLGAELRRYHDDLYLLKPAQRLTPLLKPIAWLCLNTPLAITDDLWLQAQHIENPTITLTIADITVRFRQGGEKLQLKGRTCHHSLKKMFQAWNVPTWQRDHIPLIYQGDELIAVLGYYINADFLAKESCLFSQRR